MTTMFRWFFASIGAYMCASLCVVELSEKRLGFGTGVVLAIGFAALRLMGQRRHRTDKG